MTTFGSLTGRACSAELMKAIVPWTEPIRRISALPSWLTVSETPCVGFFGNWPPQKNKPRHKGKIG